MVNKDSYWDPKMNAELIEHILLFKLFDNMLKDEQSVRVASGNSFDIDDKDMERVMSVELSDTLNKLNIPENNALVEIICKHTRITQFKKGDIIVREGDYGNSAFFIAAGTVAVILPPGLSDAQLGHVADQKMGWMETIKAMCTNSIYPEDRNKGKKKRRSNTSIYIKEGHLHLTKAEEVFSKHDHVDLNAGEMFGEIGALGRTPRTTTVVAKVYCELLEIRWQGLRDLRLLSHEFRKSIDGLYRKNSLVAHLYSLPLFSSLSKSAIQLIADDTSFKTYGSFEWQNDYKNNLENNALSLLKNEPLIVAEGEYADSLYLVRSGFARVSYRYNNGYQVLQYLGQGDSFGLETIIYNWKNKDKSLPMQTSLHAVGYTDVLQVPSYIIERMVLPAMKQAEIETYLESDILNRYASKAGNSPAQDLSFNNGVLDFMSDYRFINGASTMLIDTDRCTRCDECVTACAVGHNNNPKFNRHGRHYDHFMVANACMHCYDPVCMIGCPTGAIQRKPFEGQIVIHDSICIGCSTCANACPYENIRMVEARDNNGQVMLDRESKKPVLKATKCDLCIDQLGGPACERACPHDAIKRVDIQDLPEMINWMDR